MLLSAPHNRPTRRDQREEQLKLTEAALRKLASGEIEMDAFLVEIEKLVALKPSHKR